ncbi:MAG TPA: DUF6600 domain-containing protein [Puia sp.]|nr:DUF6600 domain-containing protein [Puia sp.]
MKNFTLFCLIFIIAQVSSFAGYSQTYTGQHSYEYNPAYEDNAYQNNQDISYQSFYDDLSPYGEWIDYPGYGYVWSPNAGDNFKPYASNGYWVYSNLGWTWVSGYSWGWATFHYGRWFYDNDHGWLWQPGSEWAPAWVSWRNSDNYYGWAPLAPWFNVDISIESYNPPVDYWCFTPHEYIDRHNIFDYCINERRNVTIINNTSIINNYSNHNRYFNDGPRVTEVEQFTHNSIRPVTIRNTSYTGTSQVTNNELRIFRPKVNASSSGQRFVTAHTETFRVFAQSTNNNKIITPNGFNNRAETNRPFYQPSHNGTLFYRPNIYQPSIRQDNRQNFMERIGNAPINRQPVMKSYSENKDFQRPVQQERAMPYHHQIQMNIQPQIQTRSLQQFGQNNSFNNRRDFDRRR